MAKAITKGARDLNSQALLWWGFRWVGKLARYDVWEGSGLIIYTSPARTMRALNSAHDHACENITSDFRKCVADAHELMAEA